MNSEMKKICCAKLLLPFVLIIFSVNISAQELYPVAVDSFPNADFQKDTLSFSLDTSNLVPFFHKFSKIVNDNSGNINILHLGASHVQAGTMSHRIRRNLLSQFPDLIARRGMIFPYSAAPKCNNPNDYLVKKNTTFGLVRNVYKNVEKPLGVTGIAVYTSDTLAELTIFLKDSDLTFVTDRIILLGFPDSTWVTPTIVIDKIEYFPVSVDTADRRYIYDVPFVKDSFDIRFNCPPNGSFTLTGIFLDSDAPGISFHSIGVNGANSNDYLKCDYFEKDLQLINPDLVIFGIGINDAAGSSFDTVAFERNYLMLINKIKNVNPDCAFIFITNNDSYKRVSRRKYAVNQNGPIIRRAFYRLAEQTGGAVWDQFDIMGGLRSMEKWRVAKLAQYDRVHFTYSGYNIMGDLFFNAFLDAWEKVKNLPPSN